MALFTSLQECYEHWLAGTGAVVTAHNTGGIIAHIAIVSPALHGRAERNAHCCWWRPHSSISGGQCCYRGHGQIWHQQLQQYMQWQAQHHARPAARQQPRSHAAMVIVSQPYKNIPPYHQKSPTAVYKNGPSQPHTKRIRQSIADGFSFPCRMGLRGSIFNDSQSVENRHPAEENGPHTSPYLRFYGRLYGGNMCNVKT